MGAHLIQAVRTKGKETESLKANSMTILETDTLDVSKIITRLVKEKEITTVCIGRPRLRVLDFLFGKNIFEKLLNELENKEIDLIILS
jgi:two-component system sensor histidine kinase KdpD